MKSRTETWHWIFWLDGWMNCGHREFRNTAAEVIHPWSIPKNGSECELCFRKCDRILWKCVSEKVGEENDCENSVELLIDMFFRMWTVFRESATEFFWKCGLKNSVRKMTVKIRWIFSWKRSKCRVNLSSDRMDAKFARIDLVKWSTFRAVRAFSSFSLRSKFTWEGRLQPTAEFWAALVFVSLAALTPPACARNLLTGV